MSSWFDPWGVVDAIKEFRGYYAQIKRRLDAMDATLQALVDQVTNTVGVVQSATVAAVPAVDPIEPPVG
jgi:hypothetical protein